MDLSPLLQGTIGFLAVSAGLRLLSSHGIASVKYISRRLLKSYEFQGTDSSFQTLATYIIHNSKARFKGVKTNHIQSKILTSKFPIGFTIFRFKDKKLWCYFEQETVQGCYSYRETLFIQGYGLNDIIIDDLLEEAANFIVPRIKDINYIITYLQNGSSWSSSKFLPKRIEGTLILEDTVLANINFQIENFLKSENIYFSLGTPWRMGFLFYGLPGNGKTSIANYLASKFNLPLYVLNLSGIESDSILLNLISNVPPKSILLIEDVDCFLNNRDKLNEGLTFSGVLNAIDGIYAGHGRILIMTTNNIEQLDAALIRPGRIDHKIEIKPPNEEMFNRLKKLHNSNKEIPKNLNEMSMADSINYLNT